MIRDSRVARRREAPISHTEQNRLISHVPDSNIIDFLYSSTPRFWTRRPHDAENRPISHAANDRVTSNVRASPFIDFVDSRAARICETRPAHRKNLRVLHRPRLELHRLLGFARLLSSLHG
jgi:hypothetical protein